MKKYLKINEKDNVAVALLPLAAGFVLNDGTRLLENIEQGHKIALKEIQEKEAIIKYGSLIGYATERIPRGSHVHTHNIRTSLGEDESYVYEPVETDEVEIEEDSFEGYLRSDGKAGVRNEIWIIPTVGCVNSVVKKMESLSRHLISGTLEDIIAFNHPYGCSQMGDDQENTM